jgi:glycosyltransferase involved in cell wall biosynthesis
MNQAVNAADSRTDQYAPIALFAYNRKDHLQSTIEALLKNQEARTSALYVFSDGARGANDEEAVAEVRRYIRKVEGFSDIRIIERQNNFGLSKSIITGVTSVCGEWGRVIVLEDDMIVSRYFLKFMNDALRLYEDCHEVISIHGYVYPVERELPETWFLRAAHCWGWATWQRGWDLFEPNGQRLLDEMGRRNLTAQFDFDGSYPYQQMLRDQVRGRNDSWAIRWYASAFLQGKLTLYPARSLVYNTGMDGSGVHCSVTNRYASEVADRPIVVEKMDAVENTDARSAIADFFRGMRRRNPLRAVAKFASKVLSRVAH